MARTGKRLKNAGAQVDRGNQYPLKEALDLARQVAAARFDETVELSVRLSVDPRQADQNVRGTVVLPQGTGRKVRVLVFAKGEKEREALDAGAETVGGDDLVKKIADEGWLEFDRAVATPDMMSTVGRIGKILGPRGLMPNPKLGTVTFDVARAVAELKSGKVEFRVDKGANVHVPIGKVSFGTERLGENARAVIDALMKAKPAVAKGNYILGVAVATTMGPGIKVNPQVARSAAA